MRIYSIYDNKAKIYGTPFMQKSDVQAVRTFAASVNHDEPHNVMHTNSADFDLYSIGTFNEDTAALTNEISHLVNGEKLLKNT